MREVAEGEADMRAQKAEVAMLPARPSRQPTPVLFGRAAELRALESLLHALPDGGAGLVVRGEAGIGKSALLGEASRWAADRDMLVLRTAGVQSEARLAFAGLHQLLHPVLGEAEVLQAPLRTALLAAFGMAEAEAHDLFRVALATLALLRERSRRAPILLLAEDVHWLDAATCDVLAFVARRLESHPIVLLAAGRTGVETSLERAGLAQLELRRLADDAAAALLDAQAAHVAPAVRDRLLAEAEGNPLALVELPIATGRLRPGTLPPARLPLTTHLERAFTSRVVGLPTATRMLLLVAALNDGDAVGEALGAASILGGSRLTAQDLAPAIDAALVDVDDGALRFRHPLMRAAVAQAANTSQRWRAHAALAAALADEPDRRTWHRAASIVAPHETIAAELEHVAGRARRRGAITAAVTALERAAQLSDDPARRGARLLHAAELAFELGRRDVVLRLLDEAEPLELAAPDRDRLRWLREFLDERPWSGSADAAASVALAERMLAAGDAARALDALMTLALGCWWSNPEQETRDLVVAAAERLPVAPADPKLLVVLGLADPPRRGGDVIERVSALTPDPDGDPEALRLVGMAASTLGAPLQAMRFFAGAIEGLRAQGRLGLLARALVSQAWAAVQLGSWSLALTAAEDAGRLTRETAQPRWEAAAQLAQATVVGLRGEAQEAEALVARAERVLLPLGSNPMLAMVQLARGATALASHDHEHAYDDLRRIFDPVDIAFHPLVQSWVLLDLVDAAVHSGHHDEARVVLRQMEELAARMPAPLLQVSLSCARPLLARDEEAEALFEAGLTADLASWPFLRARLLLGHGVWLRRRRRAVDSRLPLRVARDAFDALGAIPWSDRARHELRASGESSRHRAPDVHGELTPQELHIAQMAARGLSNRDIGQQLYLSHRTVSSHLYRIFPKLGITSRAELGRALGQAGDNIAVASPKRAPGARPTRGRRPSPC
jgi:DNA-binding CsgD family transcriptional regulator/tetratricopeptide (TPR) repeat protein